jgi:hypothetical protein
MRSVTCIAILLAAAFAAGAVIGQQSLIQSQGQVLVYSGQSGMATGDPVPGSGAGELFGGAGLDSAVIDDAGNALFRASIVDSLGAAYVSPQAGLGKGYFYGNSRTGLVKVLRGHDPELSGTIPNAILSTASGLSASFGLQTRIAGNGTILFGTMLFDPVNGSLSSADNEVLYYGTPGNWQILARKGDVAPGTGGATFVQAFNGMTFQQNGNNSGGWYLHFGALTGTGITTANNNGWFHGTPGNMNPVIRKGDVAPGGEVISNLLTGNVTQMNSSGQFVTDVTYLSGTAGVTNVNDRCVWLYTPGMGNQTLVREGDATPIAGTFFANPSNGWSLSTGPSTFGANGTLLANTLLTGAGITTNVNDKAVVLLSTAGHSVVFQRGTTAAPGVPGATFDNVSDNSLGMNAQGRIAFQSSIIGGGVIATNDTGIWTGTPGNLTLVAREGDVAPGTGGLTFGNTTGPFMCLNGAGQVIFQNTLSNAQTSLWSWDPVLGLQCVVRNGDSVEVQPGVFKTVGSPGLFNNNNGNGRPLGFNDAGYAAVRLTFSDTSSAMVLVRVGSLTGIPARISEATGATHNLYLNAGAANAGLNYIVAGSTSTTPGTTIGAITVPLNIDAYTQFTLANINVLPYVNTAGTLNGDGRALAQVVIPPLPGFAGTVVYHAYGVLDAFNNLVFASEPARLEIIP